MGLGEILSLTGSFLAIVGVLVLTYYASRWYAKRMSPMNGQGRYVKVVDRTSLGQGSAVYIIKAGEKYFLLGGGDKNVSMLAELFDFVEEPVSQKNTEIPFRQLFSNVMDKVKKPENKDNGGMK